MKLLIVGAGGHGRCCLDIARSLHKYEKIAFLDDHSVNEVINDCKVIGAIDEMTSYYLDYEHIFIALGNNEFRSKLIKQAKSIGYTIDTLISPTSCVSNYATVKEGSVIFPHVVVEANASIGEGCIITSNSTVHHDALIEEYCLIYSNSVIRPNTVIGRMTKIGSGSVISFGTHVSASSDLKEGVCFDV